MLARLTAYLAQTGLIVVAALLIASTGASLLAEEGKESHERVVVVVGGGDEAGYWIGIECEPVSDVLRSQLNLGKNQGLLIEQVVPESPAAKAGLQANDVITQAGEKPVGEVGELIKLIAQSKNGELKLRVLRGGEAKTIAVKPAKREGGQVIRLNELKEDENAREHLEQVKQQLEKALVQAQQQRERAGTQREGSEKREQEAQRQGTIYRALPGQSGAAVWTTSPPAFALPDDMQVNISKQGKQPAKVTVKQGEKSWEATEDKLDKLPPEVRIHVGRMLGRAIGPWGQVQVLQQPGATAKPLEARGVQVVIGEDGKVQVKEGGVQVPLNPKEFRLEGKEAPNPGAPVAKTIPGGVRIEVQEPAKVKTAATPQAPNPRPSGWTVLNQPAAQPDQRLEHRLHEMQEQIDQLRKTVDELRKSSDANSENKPRRKAAKKAADRS